MKPVNSCLFIKVDEEEKTASGLVLGSAIDTPKFTGVVVHGFTWLGERVVFDLYNAKPVTVDSEKFLVVKEEDIFGIMEKEK
jgi:co-chaperonin GroES (HSP10)